MATAPPPAGHEALKALLMGPGTGQMNLSQVRAGKEREEERSQGCPQAPHTHSPPCLPPHQVRARAEELKRSLDQVIHALQFSPDRVQW